MADSRDTSNFYASGEYAGNNPTLGVEDTQWKLTKLIPLVDEFIMDSALKEVRLLDVGGGAGLISKGIADYMRKKGTTVKQYALDLSEEMLRIQKENNHGIEIFVGSIERTSFAHKEIDIVLMIDVLEHVPDVILTLEELSRISKYVILKVPLENNLFYNVVNFIKMGRLRNDIFQKVGHIHFYNFGKLSNQIVGHTGEILNYGFTNQFQYMLSKDYHRRLNIQEKAIFTLGRLVFTSSPYLCACLFPDAVVCLVKCK